MKATVPITTLSIDRCQATLDEILITIKPKNLKHPSVHGIAASANLSASNMFAPDEEDQKPTQDIMTDGIMQIAGGIESVVQQLQLQVMSVFQNAFACHCTAVYNSRNQALSVSMDWKALFLLS